MAAVFFIIAGALAFAVMAIALFVLWAAGVHALRETKARCRHVARAAFVACAACAALAWWNW